MDGERALFLLVAFLIASAAHGAQLRCARHFIEGYDLDRFNSAVQTSMPAGFVRQRAAQYCSNNDFGRGWVETRHHSLSGGVEVWHEISCERGLQYTPAWTCETELKQRVKVDEVLRGIPVPLELFFEKLPMADARTLLTRASNLINGDQTLASCPGLEPPSDEDVKNWPEIRHRLLKDIGPESHVTVSLEHGAFSIDFGSVNGIELFFTMVHEGHACFQEYIVVD